MKIGLVIGADGTIGSALLAALERDGRFLAAGTSRRQDSGKRRRHLDLLQPVPVIPDADVVWYCAGIARFIDCETRRESYRVNVDVPLSIIAAMGRGLLVYPSSDAVELALHTNYGMQKALAEVALLATGRVAVLRMARVTPENIASACAALIDLGIAGRRGLSRWEGA